ncbi:MAG TPA: hypothetical protein VFP59_06445 [Candidatus Angelobacter sp.]|nr:hypothetical protein [Candidatus Angelobacter sp.]
MSKHFRGILALSIALLLLLPAAATAQQTDSSNQSQAQSNDSTANPQTRRGRGMWRRRGNSMAQVLRKLNLTDAQKQQFHQIRQDWMKQARAIRSDSSLANNQKHEKMQALRKQEHQQIFSMLTPEQKVTLKQIREQHQKEMQEKHEGSAGQASADPNPGRAADDDPFAGMTSDDDSPGI